MTHPALGHDDDILVGAVAFGRVVHPDYHLAVFFGVALARVFSIERGSKVASRTNRAKKIEWKPGDLTSGSQNLGYHELLSDIEKKTFPPSIQPCSSPHELRPAPHLFRWPRVACVFGPQRTPGSQPFQLRGVKAQLTGQPSTPAASSEKHDRAGFVANPTSSFCFKCTLHGKHLARCDQRVKRHAERG